MEDLPALSMKYVAGIIQDELNAIAPMQHLLLAKTMKRSAEHFYEMLDNLCNW